MDFFERQDRARRKTGLLVFYFGLAVVLLTLMVYSVAALALSRQQPLNLELLAWVSLGTLAVVVVGMLAKTAQLARGGRAVAEMLGGQLLNPNTTDPDERKLLNVVEEMSLASGVPVPAVYILRQEEGINAFAAGLNTSDAAVGVTRGAVQLLSRDELQGVIAHEFSHILNGDMRLNLRLIGWIFGIMCLALIGRILIHVRGGGSSSGKGANALPLIGLALILVGWIGVLFGRLIQSAVSRQREFLADAAAVQFTRNPAGLAGALKKIGGLVYGSRMTNAHAAEAGHLFFGSALEGALAGLFATHPPLTQRIRALEPGFDGKFPKVSRESAMAAAEHRPLRTPPPPLQAPMAAGVAALSGESGTASRRVNLQGADYAARFGAPQSVHLVKASEILGQLPEELQEALHDGLGASALVYGMLLGIEEALRKRQLHTLSLRISAAMAGEAQKMWRLLTGLPIEHRLPLLELAASGLRELSPAQFQQFKNTSRALAEMDGEIDLFEYVLLKVVLYGVEPFFAPPGRRVVEFYSLKALLPDCSILISGLAHLGHTKAGAAQVAFARGMAGLVPKAEVQPGLLPMDQCGLAAVDQALDRLARGAPQVRKQVLNACAVTVASDGQVRSGEAELLRAIALTLDCPLPPFVQ